MRNKIMLVVALALGAGAGCDSTVPESKVASCEPLPPAVTPAEARFYVYMSPGGSDENPGSETAPVVTLRRVQEILRETRPDSNVIVRIRSDAGVYYGQSVIWDYFDSDHYILFESWPDSIRATFSQGSADTVFFVLKASAGRPTYIHLRRLTVQGYAAGAISFIGDADESGWNGANSIVDCVMQDIGNVAQPGRHISWGVIDFVNSRHNSIRDCAFIDCANANTNEFPQDTSRELLASGADQPIIGVYLAHHSGCNQITGCAFRRVKGDAVRIRDDSNGNEICYCYFRQTGWTAVCTMWYRHAEALAFAAAECPSWSNTFHHNRTGSAASRRCFTI
jgi:hypothetical protein